MQFHRDQEFEPFESARLSDFLFSHDGKRLLVVSNDQEVERPLECWDVSTGEPGEPMDLPGNILRYGATPGLILVTSVSRQTQFRLDQPNLPRVRYLSIDRQRVVPMELSHDREFVLYYVPPPSNAQARHRLVVHRVSNSEEKDLQMLTSQIVDVACSPLNNQVAMV